MATLTGQSIASSYEQLLHVDNDGGGNGTTHVAVKDGDNGTTFPITLATDAIMITSTNRLEFGDDGTYIHQSADGVLDLVSDTEIEINATTIDMNGALDLSGNGTIGGTVQIGTHTSGTPTASNLFLVGTGAATEGIKVARGGGGQNPLDQYAQLNMFGGTTNLISRGGTSGEGTIGLVTTSNGSTYNYRLFVNSNGNVAIGDYTSPDQTLHVYRGSAGTIDAVSSSGIVLEDDTSVFMQFLSPNNADVGLVFGDPDDNDIGGIFYEHANNKLAFRTNTTTAFTLDSSQNATFNADVKISKASGSTTQSFVPATGQSSQIKFMQDDGSTQDARIFAPEGAQDLAFEAGTTEVARMIPSSLNPGTDDSIDLGSSSKRWDDIHATNGTIQTSDQALKDNIADSSLGLDFVNALRPVEYKWKDYTYDIEKEEAVKAQEAKDAVMGTRQKTVLREVEKTRTEIVEEDGKYVQKETSHTETVKEPQYEEVDLYDEDGKVIGSHKIPIIEEYEVEPAIEAIEAKDAVIKTKEKTFARTHFGLIAQEVEQVLKDKKLTNNDFAGLIYDEDSKRYGMRYSELIAPLIKAVQELSAKVIELENK